MSKIALVADIHLAGKNIDNTISLLRAMIEDCRLEKVDYILNAGDTFDCGEIGDKVLPAETIVSRLEEVMNVEIPVITIEGNHDQWGLKGSALELIHFQNWIKVKDKAEILGFKDFEVACIPWIRNDKDYFKNVMGVLNSYSQPSNKTRIVLGHLNVIGCAIGKYGYCDSNHYFSFGVDNLKFSKFNPDYMFFGHIHAKLNFEHNARYLGALCQRRFGEDEGKPSGYYIFDTETGKLKFKCLDHIASRFFSIKEEDLHNYNTDRDFVRFYTLHPEKYEGNDHIKALPLKNLDTDLEENKVREDFKYDNVDINVLVEKYCEITNLKEPTSSFYQAEKHTIKIGLCKKETGLSRIKRIKLKNVGVHKDTEVTLRDGYTVITGRNGVGKTTLIESIPGCLYDSFPVRGHVKNYIYDKGFIELDLETPSGNFVVSKIQNSSKSLVSKINEKIFNLAGAYAKEISDIFGDETTFCKLVMMDQMGSYDLVKEKDSSRLKILRELFDLSDLDKKHEAYKFQLKEEKLKLTNLIKSRENISLLEKQIQDIEVEDTPPEDLTETLIKKDKQLKELKKKQQDRYASLAASKDLEFIRVFKLNNDIEELETITKEIKKLEDNLKIKASWNEIGCKDNPLPCVFIRNRKALNSNVDEEAKLEELKNKIPAKYKDFIYLEQKYRNVKEQPDTTDYSDLIDKLTEEITEIKMSQVRNKERLNLLAIKNRLIKELDICKQSCSSTEQSLLEERILDLTFLTNLCGKTGISLYMIKLLALELQTIIDELIKKTELNLKIKLVTSDAPENLDMLSILFGDKGYDVNKASGGEIALVKILFKLAIMLYLNRYFGNYKVLCLDEPTAGLDDVNKEVVLDIIKLFKKEFNQIIVVSHDTRLVNSADNRIVL